MFHEQFYGARQEKILDPNTVTFGVTKANLGQFKHPRTYQAISPEPLSHFLQTGTSRIMRWIQKKFLDLGVWDLETTFGTLSPKRRIKL